jgi:tricorn protease
MRVRIDPRVEWAQIYHDAWLIMRDWFYDPGLHGVDWPAMYEKYRPLVDHVAHRADLDFVIAELIAELNVGHAYVNSSPEQPRVERVPVGLLGAEFEPAGDRYRIANILPGENWHEEFRSPLTEPGAGVVVGDYLIAIDGDPITTADNPYRLLENKADRVVQVTVSGRADGREPRTYEVRPVASELGLRYLAWVQRNAALVDSLSNGRIGYIHLPNTAVPGHRALFEGFRPLHDKDALIIDDRYNGGGFIPEEMALMLGRPLLNFWSRRHMNLYSQPVVVHTGPKAMLVNGQSSSGGDAIAYYFRQLGLGPVIGERTWGGLVGISGNPGFVDGGGIAVPAFAFVDSEGNWAVEGEGVPPDIEVLDRPEEIAAGREPMIEAAVEYLLLELAKPQYRRPQTPPGPRRGHPDPGS